MRTIPHRELRNQKRHWVSRAKVMKLLADGKPDLRYFEDTAELGTLDDLLLPQERVEVRELELQPLVDRPLP